MSGPRRRARQPEKAIQAQIVTFLRSIGAHVLVLGTRRAGRCRACGAPADQGTRQTPGIPDLYAILPTSPEWRVGQRRDLWIEVKAPGGRLTPEQAAFRAACGRGGHSVPHIVGGLDTLLEYLVAGGWVKAANLPHYRTASAQRPPLQ